MRKGEVSELAIRYDHIDKTVDELVQEHGTRNPYEIAEEKNIFVVEENLGDIYGYYQKRFQIKLIHLNKELDEHFGRFTCAHELGHALLHPNENTPKLLQKSLNEGVLIEGEANYFGLKLLIDGSHLEEDSLDTTEKILAYYGLPLELERLLKKTPFTRHLT